MKSHEWSRVRPFLQDKKLQARVVCRFCPAERKMLYDPGQNAWKETGGAGLNALCSGQT